MLSSFGYFIVILPFFFFVLAGGFYHFCFASLWKELTKRELEYVSLSRDTTESDLKQRREIENGTASYIDQVNLIELLSMSGVNNLITWKKTDVLINYVWRKLCKNLAGVNRSLYIKYFSYRWHRKDRSWMFLNFLPGKTRGETKMVQDSMEWIQHLIRCLTSAWHICCLKKYNSFLISLYRMLFLLLLKSLWSCELVFFAAGSVRMLR